MSRRGWKAGLALLIVAALLAAFFTTTFAQASGYWKLTDVIEQVDPDTEGFSGGSGDSIFGKQSTLSHGEFYQLQTAARECTDCHVFHSNECRVTASMPPDSLRPGETVTLYVTIEGKASDTDCDDGFDRLDAGFEAAFMPTMYTSTVRFVDEAGDGWFGTDVESGIAYIQKTITATVPEGTDSTYEQQLELLMNYCSDGSTRLIYTWVAETAAPAYSETEQYQDGDTADFEEDPGVATDFEEDDGGLSPLAVVAGVVVLGGAAVLVIYLVKKKPRPSNPAKSSAPEVTDWRGNKIDENARVQQTHQKYTRANQDAQAEYDANRRAEEAARRQHEAAQVEMAVELIRISQRLSTTTRDAAWKLNEITCKQIDGTLLGKELDPATVKRIKDGFGKLAGGKIIGLDDIPPMPTDAQFAVRAYENAFEEVCRNQTATAVAARTVSFVLSGGASNILFQAGKSFYRSKDYIDAGGDSTMGAVSNALFGEARDRAVNSLSDKVMGKLPFTPKGRSLPKKIMYDQRKRYVKQAVNAADSSTVGTNDKALKLIRWIFE